MKATDLRIGNIVEIENEIYHPKMKGIPLIVTGIHQILGSKREFTHSVSLEVANKKENTYYESYSQFIEHIKPIPINEEWLLKFGFDVKEPVLISSWKFSPFCDTIITKCEYVHQLQNLYFALTGTELIQK